MNRYQQLDDVITRSAYCMAQVDDKGLVPILKYQIVEIPAFRSKVANEMASTILHFDEQIVAVARVVRNVLSVTVDDEIGWFGSCSRAFDNAYIFVSAWQRR